MINVCLYSQPAQEALVNEDAAGVVLFENRCVAWVIDGATGVEKVLTDQEQSDAAWLSSTLDSFLRTASTDSFQGGRTAEAIVSEAADQLTFAFRSMLGDNCVEAIPRHALPSASVVFIQMRWASDSDVYSVEVVRLGDCTFLGRDKENSWRLGSTLGSDFDAEFDAIAAEFSDPAHPERGRQIREAIIRRRSAMNQPGGFAILTPEPLPDRQFHCDTLLMSAPFAIVLASDGLYRAVDKYSLVDDEGFLNLCRGCEVDSLYHEMRKLERGDARCLRYPRAKAFDDATSVGIASIYEGSVG